MTSIRLTSVQAVQIRIALQRYQTNADDIADLEHYDAPHHVVEDLVNDILEVVNRG